MEHAVLLREPGVQPDLFRTEEAGTTRLGDVACREQRRHPQSEAVQDHRGGYGCSHAVGERRTLDPPVLKHTPLLRVTLGHLTNPARLKEILQEHLAYADEMHRNAAKDAKWAGVDPAWAYARIALQWAKRYYANERELTLKMIKELDEAEETFPRAGEGGRTK